MKTWIAVLLAAIMLLGLTACAAPPCEHTYSESVEREAAVAVDGVKKFTCDLCGDSYTEAIPATRSLKVLALGNSFSQGAMANLYNIMTSGGVEEVVVANMYIGACEVKTHFVNLVQEKAAYQYQVNTAAGWQFPDEDNAALISIQEALSREDWDIITIQQASATSGILESHEWLTKLLDRLEPLVDDKVKFYWHQTWAYQADSPHQAFSNYNHDQMIMYNAIMDATRWVMQDDRIFGMIPAGTAVQNARTSVLGDKLTLDGHHLNRQHGEYLAGLTWYATLTGGTPDMVEWVPSYLKSDERGVQACREAVVAALAEPYSVTVSTII